MRKESEKRAWEKKVSRESEKIKWEKKMRRESEKRKWEKKVRKEKRKWGKWAKEGLFDSRSKSIYFGALS